jgi:3-hydroxybutyryl-CoA dehydrogenase
MPATPIESVLVAGAGSIGIGVARSCTAHGLRTIVLSRDPSRLQGQVPGAELVRELPAQAPDLVVECLPEVAALKQSFYADVERAWSGSTVLATNSSGLPLQELAATLHHPAQFLGMHYMYPAHERGLFVEVIRAHDTADTVVQAVLEMLHRCGKTSIVLNRPVIGGLFNRLQHALLREAYHLIDEGAATPEQIDEMARRFIAPRMCVTGLLLQKDINGLDTHARTQRNLRPVLCNDPEPSPFLEGLFERGEFGLKTGVGFYDWTGADPAQVRSAVERKVARIVQVMQDIQDEPGAQLPARSRT